MAMYALNQRLFKFYVIFAINIFFEKIIIEKNFHFISLSS